MTIPLILESKRLQTHKRGVAGMATTGALCTLFLLGGAFSSRAWAQKGVISTVAGEAKGSLEPNLQAIFSAPTQVAVDHDGNLFVADEPNNRIRRVAAGSGQVTTVAGTGVIGSSPDGTVATKARLWAPYGVAVDSQGTLFFSDCDNNVIRRLDKTTGLLSVVAGSGKTTGADNGLLATFASLSNPKGIAFDLNDNLFIADTFNNRVCRVDRKTGVFSVVAGTGSTGFTGDDGPALQATFNRPYGVAVDGAGNVFVADTLNFVVRRIDAQTKSISTVAGLGTSGNSGDGFPATQAQLGSPYGLTVDGVGNLFIADFSNSAIRCISAKTGLITRVAGGNGMGTKGDGGPAIKAQLKLPQGVILDGAGNLFIADTSNSLVRRVNEVGTTLDSSAFLGKGVARPRQQRLPVFSLPAKGDTMSTVALKGTELPANGGVYELEPFNLPGQRMTLVPGGVGSAAKLILAPADDSPLQGWKFSSAGNEMWWLSPPDASTHLDSNQNGHGLNSNLAIRPVSSSDNQKWTITPLGDGLYSVQTPSAPDAPLTALVTKSNGTFVTFQPNGGRPDQRWRLLMRQSVRPYSPHLPIKIKP